MAEMKWLAADFNEERKRFAKKRKEINKAILSVSKLKKEAKQRKRQELMKEQKVVAKHISKHVAMYWNKIDKIVVYKHKGQLYERRSELMDRHLQFMLKQTEDYTQRLSKNIKEGSTTSRLISRIIHSRWRRIPCPIPSESKIHSSSLSRERT